MPSDYILVLTTAPSEDAAALLARALVDAHLAACVHIHAIRSIYRWQGNIHDEPEWRLVIKTSPGLYTKVEQFIQARHTYQTPEIVRIDIAGGSADCLRWIGDCLDPADSLPS